MSEPDFHFTFPFSNFQYPLSQSTVGRNSEGGRKPNIYFGVFRRSKMAKSLNMAKKPQDFIFYWTKVSLGSDLWARFSQTDWDTFLKLNWCDSSWWRYELNRTDNANRAILQCKLYNLVANFRNNASDVTWLPNFEPICKKYIHIYLNCHLPKSPVSPE